MFLHCAIAYIITLLISVTLFTSYLIYIIIFSLIFLPIILYFIKKYYPMHMGYYPIAVFSLWAMISVYYFNTINSNVLLDKKTDLISVYGTIYDIQNSRYDAKNHIFLKDLISKQDINFPSNLRLTYKYDDLQIGDIIKINVFLFPTHSKIYPYGLNLEYGAIAKKIGAYGFILGKAEIIRNSNELGLYHVLQLKIKDIKDKLIQQIKSYNLQHEGFLIAITLGESNWIAPSDLKAMQLSSLAHLISISGYHISIIAVLIFFTIRFGLSLIPNLALLLNLKKIAALFTILILIGYIFLLEFPLPATRATIMIIAFMVSILLNFKAFSLNSLFLACIIILTINPYYIFSAGFLLSCVATMTIILFVNNPIVQYINKIKYNYNIMIRFIVVILLSMLLTLCVELSIAPILGFYFGYIPLLGMFSNALASPLFSFIIMPFMMMYFITPHFIAIYFIKIANFTMGYLLEIARFFSAKEYSLFTTEFFPNYVLLYCLLAYLFAVILKNKKIKLAILMTYFLVLGYHFMTFKKPSILIDDSFESIALQQNDSYYISNRANKFILQAWFKDKYNLQPLLYNNNNCQNNHCIFHIKDKKIILAKHSFLLSEDCGYADLIILESKAPFLCKNTPIIDNDFINRHATTFIYINDIITIETSYND